MTIQISGDDYTGYVVIDSIVHNTSSGGVRIAADVSLEEVRELAQEMTLKYALFRLPRGGTKAGVRLAVDLDPEARLRALQDFGRKLAPLVRTGIFNPGMDMNCGPDELRAIYRGAGVELAAVTDTAWFTGLSAANAIAACVAELGTAGRPATLVIEGFGSVGRHLAARLPPSDYTIVGVATVRGAVWNPEGWEPRLLADLKTRFGDELVDRLPGERITRDELLCRDVDVLVPSARTRAIGPEIAPRLRARAVVPIANAPYADGAVDILHRKDIVCLPGYLANVGGVLASALFDEGVARSDVERLFDAHYRAIVGKLIRTGRRLGVPAAGLAAALAEKRFPERARQATPSLGARVYRRLVARRLPRAVRGNLARRRCLASMRALAGEIDALGRVR